MTPADRERLEEINSRRIELWDKFETLKNVVWLSEKLESAWAENEKLNAELAEFKSISGKLRSRPASAELLSELPKEGVQPSCPPHKWDSSGERCEKCGDKDWMT